MCGIVGYVGQQPATPVLLDGLQRMEYRGYDSAGIALPKIGNTCVIKTEGRVQDLAFKVGSEHTEHIGIGHTRWATHGGVSSTNAHPHQSSTGRVTLAHNGVVDNYLELKHELEQKGIKFYSETDTEVIANVLEDVLKTETNTLRAINQLRSILEGLFALVIIDNLHPDTIYVIRHRAPLIIGRGKGFNMVASDVLALVKHTKDFVALDDGDIAVLTDKEVRFYHDTKEISKKGFTLDINPENIDKGIYDTFMMKEIHEQPTVLRSILSKYVKDDVISIKPNFVEALRKADCIQIIASGTSYHAGLIGKQLFEKLLRKRVDIHYGSEFAYNVPPFEGCNPAFLLISQSGETADLRAAMEAIKKLGAPIFTITNVYGSTLAREANDYLLLHAGPEVAVASTKAYVAQVTLLALLTEAVQGKPLSVFADQISKASYVIEDVMEMNKKIEKMVETTIVPSRNAFFIGRNIDYYISLEAALKLKEISYIQAEGFAGGELKHGTIALIEKGVPVVGIISQPRVAASLRSNLEEVKARGAKVVTIAFESMSKSTDDFIVPDIDPLLSPLVIAPIVQLIAYYAAKQKGKDIDKPRNLAKSVTVE